MATTFHPFLRLERELRDRIYREVVTQEEPIEFDQRVQDYHAFDIESDGYKGGEVSSERMEDLNNDMHSADLQEEDLVDEEYEDPTTTTDYYCNIQTTLEGPVRRKLGSLSILWLNKRIQREAAKIAYSGNTFQFKETNTLGLWLNQIGTRNCRYIKHLRVDCLDYENRVGKGNIAVSIGEALQHLTLSTDLELITIGHEFACQLIDDDASPRNDHFLAVMGMANAFYLQFNAAQTAEGKTPRDRSQMLKLDPVPTCTVGGRPVGRCLASSACPSKLLPLFDH